MSAPIDDGGPAFPTSPQRSASVRVSDDEIHMTHGGAGDGMTLRDWFAGKASEQDIKDHRDKFNASGTWCGTNTRDEARYAYADDMIAARKKGATS